VPAPAAVPPAATSTTFQGFGMGPCRPSCTRARLRGCQYVYRDPEPGCDGPHRHPSGTDARWHRRRRPAGRSLRSRRGSGGHDRGGRVAPDQP